MAADGHLSTSETVNKSPEGTFGMTTDPTNVHRFGVTRVAGGDQ